ncbi:hypothetical protein HA402_015398 [Bradysia odoriphaga]|nr:hypothetical protein HA402_015398 [Bradysia odoriphaga]
MAESISRDSYGNKEEEDYDSSEQSASQHTSSNNDKYDDPAILSCGSAQREDRITYDRDHLLQLRNSPLSRKRPDYVLEGLTLRKLWCRATDLMIGGEERTTGRSTNNSTHEFRSKYEWYIDRRVHISDALVCGETTTERNENCSQTGRQRDYHSNYNEYECQ